MWPRFGYCPLQPAILYLRRYLPTSSGAAIRPLIDGDIRPAYLRPTLADEIDSIEKQIPFFSPQDRAKIPGVNAANPWAVQT